jgi:hypothetical protein
MTDCNCYCRASPIACRAILTPFQAVRHPLALSDFIGERPVVFEKRDMNHYIHPEIEWQPPED